MVYFAHRWERKESHETYNHLHCYSARSGTGSGRAGRLQQLVIVIGKRIGVRIGISVGKRIGGVGISV